METKRTRASHIAEAQPQVETDAHAGMSFGEWLNSKAYSVGWPALNVGTLGAASVKALRQENMAAGVLTSVWVVSEIARSRYSYRRRKRLREERQAQKSGNSDKRNDGTLDQVLNDVSSGLAISL